MQQSNKKLLWFGAAVLLSFAGLATYSYLLSQRINSLENRASALEEIFRPTRAVEPNGLPNCGEPTCPVSMIQLLSHPERYNGWLIRVPGTYCEAFEMSALFAPGTPVKTGPLAIEHSIWVSNPNIPADKWAYAPPSFGKNMKTNCAQVMMSGTFKSGKAGHLSQYFGELLGVATEVYER